MVGPGHRRLHRYEEERQHREHLVQLGEAARTLAHEIRNPLGAIRLQTAMLRKQAGATDGAGAAGAAGAAAAGVAGGAGRTHGAGAPEAPTGPVDPGPRLDILDEETGRIDALVNQVREFLQDPAGAPEDVELAGFLESLPSRYSFRVDLDVQCSPPCTVRFDRHRLHSVLGNVLRNAAEAAAGAAADPDTGAEAAAGASPVELALYRHRDGIRIRVADRGAGLPADAGDDHVFDPFYSRKEGGFGVGLAVSRRFVEAAGGTIALRNRDDGPGAECIIELPEVHPDARVDS